MKTGTHARVESHCTASGAEIRLDLAPHGIERVAPPDTVMSFLEPEEERLRANTMVSFCHFVHFFRSPADAAAWIAGPPGTFVLTLDEGFRLGSKMNALRYGDVLQPA